MLKKPLRVPPTPVPAAKNTHMCFGINIPEDVVVNRRLPLGFEPVLDNTVVMHHMNLWRCPDIPSTDFTASCNTSLPVFTARCTNALKAVVIKLNSEHKRRMQYGDALFEQLVHRGVECLQTKVNSYQSFQRFNKSPRSYN